jgi:hypothetical protein
MRLCPSVEGSASPLITHRIGGDVCLARQATNFHKCHRCIYRGQAADWAPDEPDLATLDMQKARDAKPRDAREVMIPRPQPADEHVAADG